jgi:heme A synthase
VRRAGYRICLDPTIRSYQYLRPDLGALLRQKSANGFWIGVSQWLSPGSVRLFHRVPAAFVLALALTLAIAAVATAIPFLALAALYLALAVVVSVKAVAQAKQRSLAMIALPVVFAAMHICYGVATWAGLLRGAWLFARERRPKP